MGVGGLPRPTRQAGPGRRWCLFLGALLRNRRWTLTELGLLLFGLYSGLTYVRFLFLLAIVGAPIFAKLFDFVPPYREEADTPYVNAFVILLLVSAIIYYRPNSAQLDASVGQMYPAHVVPYLKADAIRRLERC